MSILNSPSDGLFNILIVFVRCLAYHGSMDRGKLISVCAPESAVASQDLAKYTLNNWIQLGVLNEDKGKVSIDRSLATAVKKSTDHSALVAIVRQQVLAVANNERFWEAKGNRSADFCRAASWMLAQNVFEVQVVGHSAIEAIEVKQLSSEHRVFINDTRWPAYKSWAPFLGFGSIGRFPTKNTFVIDPTVAVADSLPEVFGKEKELPQEQFFSRLAEALPVVDGGEYRLKVEEKINHAYWKPPKLGEISTSLSRALSRLHERGEVTLDDRDDASKRTLIGCGGRAIRNVSHVVWKGGKK